MHGYCSSARPWFPRISSAQQCAAYPGSRLGSNEATWGAKAKHAQPFKISGCFQPLDFRLEYKAQSRAFFVRQPIRHLGKDGPVQQNLPGLPWQRLRRAGLGEDSCRVPRAPNPGPPCIPAWEYLFASNLNLKGEI
jgi:hypothetical protein